MTNPPPPPCTTLRVTIGRSTGLPVTSGQQRKCTGFLRQKYTLDTMVLVYRNGKLCENSVRYEYLLYYGGLTAPKLQSVLTLCLPKIVFGGEDLLLKKWALHGTFLTRVRVSH